VSINRPPPRPTDGRALTIAVLFSLLLPGLGHAYAMRLMRALVWLLGAIAVFAVLWTGEENPALQLSMSIAIRVLAALDVALVMWLDRRARPAR
jgi:hypothetical protein